MENVKNQQTSKIDAKFKSLSERIVLQLNHIEKLLLGEPVDESIFPKIEETEKEIDQLDVELKKDFVNELLLYSPRAKMLRKIITLHEITLFLEKIGDYLESMALLYKKIDFNIFDNNNLLLSLKNVYSLSKKTTNNAIFAFYSEDKMASHRVIAEAKKISELMNNTFKNAVLDFEDIPLSKQELSNIVIISEFIFFIKGIIKNTKNIAESNIYFLEGNDIRHTKN